MKILFIDNSPLISNGDDFLVELKTGQFALELKELGNHINFYGQKVPSNVDMIHTFGVKANNMQVSGLWKRNNKIVNYVLTYLWIIKYVCKSDFIYIFYPNAFKFVTFIAFVLKKKYGVYIRGMGGINDKISHWIYKHAYTVFTVSDNFTEHVNALVCRQVAKTIKPMNYFDEKDIYYDRKYNKIIKYKLLYLGRTTNDKGIIELLNALSLIKQEREDFELSIVGTGEYIEELKALAQDLGLSSFVFFKGGIYEKDKVKECYVNADIFILPTYHEGFPRTIYEAMIFGTPIITTFVGGISTHMIDNFNCIKILPKSIDSLTCALVKAMDNYPDMIQLSKNGFKTVEKIVDSKRLTHAQELNNKLLNISTK